VTSIALQLARNVPALKQRIIDAVVERDDIARQSLRDQWHHLVLGPLSKLSNNDCSASLVLVVDALDECDSNDNIRIIVQLLAQAPLSTRARLRVLLTSRPEEPIRLGFRRVPEAEHKDVVLHNISRSIVDHDLALFLQHEFRLIAQECYLDASWPGAGIVTQLAQSASGLFIWAATACRFICDGPFADERLRVLLADSASSNPVGPEEQLTKLYLMVLQTSIRHGYNAQDMPVYYGMSQLILGSIVALNCPLPLGSLSALLRVPKHKVDQVLRDLYSILDIPDDQSQPIRLHHPSFRDFLLNKDRCADADFWVEETQAHTVLADNCIQLMANFLRKDVCRVVASGALAAEQDRTELERCLPKELQYACLYWINHLAKSGAKLCDNDEVHSFLKKHCLHWIEALGWMGKVSEGIHAISSLELITQVSHLHHT
jgi:hypothetical protein